MDAFEKCVEATGDPQLCLLAYRAGQLVGRLVECVVFRSAKECFEDCLGMCRGEGCEVTCLNAVETALGVAMAWSVATRAAEAAALLGSDPLSTIALAFDAELKKAEKRDCPERETASRVFAVVAAELYNIFRKTPNLQERAQEVLLLLAPALALGYQCVGDEVFEYLDLLRPFIEDSAKEAKNESERKGVVERIAAAMEQGGVIVGNVIIRFKPTK